MPYICCCQPDYKGGKTSKKSMGSSPPHPLCFCTVSRQLFFFSFFFLAALPSVLKSLSPSLHSVFCSAPLCKQLRDLYATCNPFSPVFQPPMKHSQTLSGSVVCFMCNYFSGLPPPLFFLAFRLESQNFTFANWHPRAQLGPSTNAKCAHVMSQPFAIFF